jgi:exodeoxyribonuclease VII large subunit
VRAVAACEVPVVSAVGHEQDTPLCDLAADARAATPTAAATLVVPDARELRAGLDETRRRLSVAVSGRLERTSRELDASEQRLRAASRLAIERHRTSLDHLGARLQSLSPHATLARGYAIVRAGGTALREAAAVSVGQELDVELASGSLGARVEDVRP